VPGAEVFEFGERQRRIDAPGDTVAAQHESARRFDVGSLKDEFDTQIARPRERDGWRFAFGRCRERAKCGVEPRRGFVRANGARLSFELGPLRRRSGRTMPRAAPAVLTAP
jgi:hypothetical protein